MVQDDTKAGSHVAKLAVRIVVNVLARVLASVSVNILQLVFLLWWLLVHGWVIIWLRNCTDPWPNRQEFLRCCCLFDLFVKVEEVVLWSVLVKFVLDDLVGLLVNSDTRCLLEAFRLLCPSFC